MVVKLNRSAQANPDSTRYHTWPEEYIFKDLLISNKITEVVESNKIQIVRMKTIYYLHNQILT